MPKFVPGSVPVGNVVKDYYIGNTRVIICDDAYRGRSGDEIRASLSNISRIASEALAEEPKEETTGARPGRSNGNDE